MALNYMSKAVKLEPRQGHLPQQSRQCAHYRHADRKRPCRILRKAVKLDPNYADAWCNLGKAWRMIGDMERAAKYFNQGAQRCSLVFCAAMRDWRKLTRKWAVLMKPLSRSSASCNLIRAMSKRCAALALARKFSEDDPLIAVFETVLRDPKMRDDERAPLHHAFGKICNDIGRYDDAIMHFSRGKELKKLKFHMELAPGHLCRDQGAVHAGVFCCPQRLRHFRTRGPCFVIGLPRSGTTFTEQILASHHAVAGLGELPDMRNIARKLGYGSPEPKSFTANVAALKQERCG